MPQPHQFILTKNLYIIAETNLSINDKFLATCTEQFNNFNTAINQLGSIGVQNCYIDYGNDYDGALNCALAITQNELQYMSLSRDCYSACNSGGSFYPCQMAL